MTPLLLKVNRTDISDFFVGIRTSMKGSAQVDVNLFDISGGRFGLEVIQSRQITNVNFNNFTGASDDGGNYFAVRDNANGDAALPNSLVMYKNTFQIGGASSVVAAGFFAINGGFGLCKRSRRHLMG